MTASVLPIRGSVFPDSRDDGRWFRVGRHPFQDLVVLSMWRGKECVATCRLAREDVPQLVSALVEGLAEPMVIDQPWSEPRRYRLVEPRSLTA